MPGCRLGEKHPVVKLLYSGSCGQALSSTTPAPARAQERTLLAYTPKHLADKILTARNALEGERKQVTVLFADTAGFTALVRDLDPEVVHEVMDHCFGLISTEVHRFEGTINQYTGDGIMALFGAPIAHEDSPRRAVHAARRARSGTGGATGPVPAGKGGPWAGDVHHRRSLHWQVAP